MSPRSAARLRLVVAAVLFSTGGAAIKAVALGGWQVAGLRSAVAAATLLVLVPASRRLRAPAVWLVGAAYAGCVLSYAVANKLTTAANTIFLQSTAPLYLLLLSPLLLGERIRRRDLVFMGALAVGLSLFFLGEEQASAVAADPVTGNLLGLVAGLCWALTLLGLRWLERETAGGAGGLAPAAVVAGNVLAALAASPMALPLGEVRPVDWLWVLYLGVAQIGIAYAVLTRGLREVTAFEASLLLLVEPVLTPLWAWWLHGEEPSGWALAGGLVILAATTLHTLREGGEQRRLRSAGGGGPAPG